jgi:hypothetical protein
MEEQTNNLNVTNPSEPEDKVKHEHGKGNFFGGIILITLGIIFLLAHFVPRVHFGDLWPILLIVIGILLLRKTVIHPKN